MALNIFIIEDHPLMRRTLNDFIQSQPDLEVAGLAGTEAEALRGLAEIEADLAIIDVRLAGGNGIHLLAQLREKYPTLPCLMLSGHNEATYIRRAFNAGAQGYILKGKPFEILKAIQTVRAGGTYLSPGLKEKLEGRNR